MVSKTRPEFKFERLDLLIEKDHNYMFYFIFGIVLWFVTSLLGFPPEITIGSFLAGNIFAFHEFMKYHFSNITAALFETGNNDEQNILHQGIIIVLDLLIAVPMFGLGELATSYIFIFLLMFFVVIFYWKMGEYLKQRMKDFYQHIEYPAIVAVIYVPGLILSIVYWNINQIGLTDLFLPEEYLQQVGNPFFGLISGIFVSSALLLLCLLMLLLLFYISPVIIAIIFPAALLLDPELFWGEDLAEISTTMEWWIVASWIVCFVIIFSSRYLSSTELENKC